MHCLLMDLHTLAADWVFRTSNRPNTNAAICKCRSNIIFVLTGVMLQSDEKLGQRERERAFYMLLPAKMG